MEITNEDINDKENKDTYDHKYNCIQLNELVGALHGSQSPLVCE